MHTNNLNPENIVETRNDDLREDSTTMPANSEILSKNNEVQFFGTYEIFTLSDEQIQKITIHPALSLIRTHNEDEIQSLENSTVTNEMLEPITITHDFTCVDGRARLDTYRNNISHVKPIFVFYEGSEDSILEYILQKNIFRRHLTKSQIAITSTKAYQYVLDERANGKNVKFFGLDLCSFKKSRDLIAFHFGISRTYISMGKFLVENEPGLAEAVLNGIYSIKAAYDMAGGKKLEENADEDEENLQTNYDKNGSVNLVISEDGEVETTINNNEIIKEVLNNLSKNKEVKDKEKSSDKTDTKPLPRVHFEQNFRPLKPLELAFIDFMVEDLKISRSEESIIALLSAEEEKKNSIMLKRTVDENFDKLTQIFMDSIYTDDFQEMEILKYSSIIEEVKAERVKNETMTLDEQLDYFNSLLDERGRKIFLLAQKQFEEKTMIELNLEDTLIGKVFNFVRKCAKLMKQESQTQGVK